MMIRLLVAILMSSCAAIAAAADYLILGTPSETVLYDQYEQRLSRTSLDELPGGTPFLIVSKKQLMGDQITYGMKLSYAGDSYFLMLDERGQLSGLPKTAKAATISSCQPLSDTMVAATRNELYRQYPRANKLFSIDKGDLVVRQLKKGEATYVKIIKNGTYGWIYPSPSALVKPLPKASHVNTSSFTTDLHQRIANRLDAANRQYAAFFTFFCNHTGVQKSTPQWTFSNDGTILTYTLQASAEIKNQLDASTRYLVNDIERIIAGKPFTVTSASGTITVRPRRAHEAEAH